MLEGIAWIKNMCQYMFKFEEENWNYEREIKNVLIIEWRSNSNNLTGFRYLDPLISKEES